jgi:hypothetical protein
MLPDYPRPKGLAKALHMKRFFDARQAQLNPFASAPVNVMHEGDRAAIQRENGSIDEVTFEQMQTERTVDVSKIEQLDHEAIVGELEDMARDIARQENAYAYEKINAAVESVGNVIDAGGPLTEDAFFDALEKMWMEFDAAGRPVYPTIVCHPDVQETWTTLLQRIETEPALRARHDALIEAKKEEWREREGARKLVG